MDAQRLRRLLPLAFLAALFIGLIARGGIPPVLAQGGTDVSLTGSAGFNGACKENHWFPVRLVVENKGPDLNARVQVAAPANNGGQSIYASDLSLPNTSRKELFLYVFSDGTPGKLTASVVVGNRTLVSTPLNVNCLDSSSLQIGLLAGDLAAYDSLRQLSLPGRSARVTRLQLADLPDKPQGWEVLDALVVSGVDMGKMTDAQRGALRLWLARGGSLLVAGGPKWQSVAGGLREFLPIDIQSTQNVDGLPELQSYFKSALPLEGEALLAVGPLRADAAVLVEQDGLPVLIQKQTGFGTVYYLSADPGLQPLSGWAGMQDVYGDLLGSRPLRPVWSDFSWDPYYSGDALASLPALGIPPTSYVVALLGLYILIIGPFNYLVLRRIKRQELAWVSIPALVILVTGFAYFTGAQIRGNRPMLNRLSVWQAWDGAGQAQVQALVGVYAPERAAYTLEARDPFLAYPYGSNDQAFQSNQTWLSRQEGAHALVPDLLVETGGMKAVALTGSAPAPAFAHALAISLGQNVPTLSGKITNASKYTLRNAVLVTPDDVRELGDFPPGSSKQVQILLGGTTASYRYLGAWTDGLTANLTGGADQAGLRRSKLLHAVTAQNLMSAGNAGIYLAGWLEGPQLPVGLPGSPAPTNFDTSLYVENLSVGFKPASGTLALTPALFIWESSDPAFSPRSVDNRELPPAGYELDFRLMAPLPYSAVKSLTLALAQDGNQPNGINVYLWDWQLAKWVQIQHPVWGDNHIQDPARYVGPGTRLRLRLEPDGSVASSSLRVIGSYFEMVVQP